MTILECIIQALTNLGGKAHYSDLYDEFEKISGRKANRSSGLFLGNPSGT